MKRAILFLFAAVCFGQIINPSNGGGGSGATIPNTTNLIKGDGAGNGADSGLIPANVVLAVSPGAGIAHFPGASQTATSSLIVTADITNANVTAAKLVNAGVLTGDVSGTFPATTVTALNGTALSGLATGLLKNTTGTGVPSIAVGSDVCSLLTLTGNVTTSAGCATTIGAAQVTNAMLAGSIAASKLIGTDIATVGTITTGTWNGSVIGGTYGGTGVNNGSSTITLGGSLTTSGAFASTFTMTGATNVTFPTSGTLSTTTGTVTSVGQSFTGGLISVAGSPITSSGTLALTVAGTSGGVPYFSGAATWASSAAMASGQFMLGGGAGSAPTTSFSVVPLANGGTNGTDAASNGGIIYSNATQHKVLAGTATANQALLSGSSAAPAWSTATYPATTTINQILYSSTGNTIAGLATANNAVLVTSAGGVPSIAAPTAPLSVSASALTCTTCATTTNGGALSATQPITISAAGVIAANAVTGTGNTIVEATSPTITTPSITTSETLSNNGIGAVSTDGYVVQNTTAAAAGAQQFSPRVHLIGQGWKTNATAASQQVEWYTQTVPVQDAANPDATLEFTPVINGTAGKAIYLCSSSNVRTFLAGLDGITAGAEAQCTNGGFAGFGTAQTQTVNVFSAWNNGTARENFTTNGLVFAAASNLMWANTTLAGQTTGDTGLCRQAARQLDINDGSTTCTNYGDLGMRKMVTYNSLATVGPGVAPIYGNVSTTGNVAAITTSTLCAAAVCTGGMYVLHAYFDSTVTCATPGPAAVGLNLTWTDDAGTKTTHTIPLDDNNALTFSSTMALGDTTTYSHARFSFWSTGANAIQYATTYTACTTGTGTYSIRLALEQQI